MYKPARCDRYRGSPCYAYAPVFLSALPLSINTMNTNNPNTPNPLPATTPLKTDIPGIEKLTPEQFESVRKHVSTLLYNAKHTAGKRFQFFVTQEEHDAITAIAKRENLGASTLIRYYLRCVHPELATLTARTKKSLVEQQRLISSIIQNDKVDTAQLSQALADLEAKTTKLMKLMEERR